MSGGPDSVALLLLLCGIRDELGLHLEVAHFDHRLSPASAGAADQVAELCEEVGVSCVFGKAGDLSGSQQEYRTARYEFFRDASRRTNASRVALAHQRDDHAETVLLNLVRGTGLRGLAGIPRRRGRFIRPLLDFRRRELRRYVSARGFPWVTDPSNADPRFLRVRVRTQMVPQLARALGADKGADLVTALAGLASAARRADEGLNVSAREVAPIVSRDERSLQVDAGTARLAETATQARILRGMASRMGVRLRRGATRAGVSFMADGVSGHGVDIGGGLRLEREFENLLVRFPAPTATGAVKEGNPVIIENASAGRGELRVGGRMYRVQWDALEVTDRQVNEDNDKGEEEDAEDGTERWTALFDSRNFRYPLRVRGLCPGDRVKTSGGRRPVRKLLGELRVPVAERDAALLVVDDDSTVIWIVGHWLPRSIRWASEPLLRIALSCAR